MLTHRARKNLTPYRSSRESAIVVQVATKSTPYGPHDRLFCMMLSLLVLAPQSGRNHCSPVSFPLTGLLLAMFEGTETMITVLIIVAIVLFGSAVFGFRGL